MGRETLLNEQQPACHTMPHTTLLLALWLGSLLVVICGLGFTVLGSDLRVDMFSKRATSLKAKGTSLNPNCRGRKHASVA